MTMIFDEESEQDSVDRFDAETAEVDSPLEPEGEVIPPMGVPEAEDDFPLESLITPNLCGLLLSIPGAVQARQTGHEFWRLDAEEKELLGSASQPFAVWLVRRYLGEGVGMFAAVGVALAAVYAPRQIREMQERAAEKKAGRRSPPAENSAPNPRTSPAEYQQSSANGDVGSRWNNEGFSVPFQE
jgi:hypothetical protein